jgi:hypothetical protein
MADQALPVTAQKSDKPTYESPRIQVMSEREILNTFQITQAMSTWWAC